MKPVFSSENIPEYHDGMLVVQLRTSPVPGAPPPAVAAAIAGAAPYAASSGMAAMSFYERAGLIKRVVPVKRSASSSVGDRFPPPGAGIAAAMMSSAAAPQDDAAAGVNVVELQPNADVASLQLALANDPGVATVSKVPVRYLAARARARPAAAGVGIAAVPPPAATMWNLRKIRWAEARAIAGFMDADNINVGVLDTGIEEAHPDLTGRVASYSWQHPDLPNASSAQDIVGHGTHVAGTIAANINNNLGVNGICACRIHAWKIFDDVPDLARAGLGFRYVYYVDHAMYLRALFDCVQERLDVVNLSIGGQGAPSAPEAQAFRSMMANGTIVVAAMGNEREAGSPISYPAAIPGVIAVGATGLTDQVTRFSNRGNHIALCAPGDGIWSLLPTYPGQLEWEAEFGADGQPRQGKPNRREVNYDAWPGTSMASPHVAGAVALYLANGGPTGTDPVREALKATVDKTPGMGASSFDPDYGAGRLNLHALVQHAQQHGGGS